MKRRVLLFTIAAAVLGTTACEQGEVAVVAQLVNEDAAGVQDTVPMQDMPVRLLPYDRDAIFDSLSAAFSEPEPAIPDSILAIQDQIADAQARWQTAETSWQQVRDSLQQISQRLQSISRGSAEYRLLFNDFSDLEPRESQLNRQREQAFQEFTQLQSRLSASSQEIRARRMQWADEAFASVDSIIEARLETLGLEEHSDTTNAAGVAQFTVKPGQWWVYARFELPYNELYWNMPVEITGGDQTIPLNRENAQVRTTLR